MRTRRVARFLLLLVLAAFLVIALRAALGPGKVEVVRPVRRDVVELIVATGYVRAENQADLGTEIQGVVEEVHVREGDAVARGEVVLTLRRAEMEARVAQLRRSLDLARSEFAKASRPAYREDVDAAKADLAAARKVNQALLDAARDRLDQLQSGGRAEERSSAEARLRRYVSAREIAESDLKRAEQLYNDGAIALAELERQRVAAAQARASEDEARQQLILAERPARQEEIAAAKAEVRAAEARLRTSEQGAEARLRRLLNEPRKEDVRVAAARVAETQAALKQALASLDKTILKAPFAGIVTKRSAEPGQSVNPGQPLVSLADMRGAEIRVDTDEINLRRLRVGQTATVFAPSYAGRPFSARLVRIGPKVDKSRGVVELRLEPVQRPSYVRPDMTVDVNIETIRLRDALALPSSTLLRENGADYVLLLTHGRLNRKRVEVLARGTQWAAISGVGGNELVALRAATMNDGDRVKPVEVPARVR